MLYDAFSYLVPLGIVHKTDLKVLTGGSNFAGAGLDHLPLSPQISHDSPPSLSLHRRRSPFHRLSPPRLSLLNLSRRRLSLPNLSRRLLLSLSHLLLLSPWPVPPAKAAAYWSIDFVSDRIAAVARGIGRRVWVSGEECERIHGGDVVWVEGRWCCWIESCDWERVWSWGDSNVSVCFDFRYWIWN